MQVDFENVHHLNIMLPCWLSIIYQYNLAYQIQIRQTLMRWNLISVVHEKRQELLPTEYQKLRYEHSEPEVKVLAPEKVANLFACQLLTQLPGSANST